MLHLAHTPDTFLLVPTICSAPLSSMKNEQGESLVTDSIAGTTSTDIAQGFARNNYQRPAGQVGIWDCGGAWW